MIHMNPHEAIQRCLMVTSLSLWLIFSIQPTQAAAPEDATIMAKGFAVTLRESPFVAQSRERTFLRDGAVLYRSSMSNKEGQLSVRILAGHASQLGDISVANGRLIVETLDAKPIWSETFAVPLCLPEVSAEFVRAHWDVLPVNGAPLKCGAPIIKAKKVAPLQWQRLPDNVDGTRVVELQPGSFGMRFFLSPTRFVFSADGATLLSQDGQFESIPEAGGRATYLMGKVVFPTPRAIMLWPKAHFYGGKVVAGK